MNFWRQLYCRLHLGCHYPKISKFFNKACLIPDLQRRLYFRCLLDRLRLPLCFPWAESGGSRGRLKSEFFSFFFSSFLLHDLPTLEPPPATGRPPQVQAAHAGELAVFCFWPPPQHL